MEDWSGIPPGVGVLRRILFDPDGFWRGLSGARSLVTRPKLDVADSELLDLVCGAAGCLGLVRFAQALALGVVVAMSIVLGRWSATYIVCADVGLLD